MKRWLTYLTFCFLLLGQLHADVYIVIYATYNGQSGHAGIAIDEYKIKIYDDNNCPDKIRVDTVPSGRLIYYDLWPLNKHFDKELVFKDVQAQMFKLPRSTAEQVITLHSLRHYGIPHQKDYPVDALLKIKLNPATCFDLVKWMDNLNSSDFIFNAVHFNCVDFVQLALQQIISHPIDAKEDIFFVKASTPNKLFLALSKLKGVSVIKDPGKKVLGSFFNEKIMKRNQS